MKSEDHVKWTMVSVCVMLVGVLGGAFAKAQDGGTGKTESGQATNSVQSSAKQPESKEVVALREKVRVAWQAFAAAKAKNPKVVELESQIQSLQTQVKDLHSKVDAAVQADENLKSFKQSFEETVALHKKTSGEAAKETLEKARLARALYIKARSDNAGIKQLEEKAQELSDQIADFRMKQDAIANEEPDLQGLKTVWQQALSAAKEGGLIMEGSRAVARPLE